VLVRIADGERTLEVRTTEVVAEDRPHLGDKLLQNVVELGIARRIGHVGRS